MGNWQTGIDISKNRMWIRASGFVTDEEMRKAVDAYIANMRKLKSGFDLIVDAVDYKPASSEGVMELEKVHRFHLEMGSGRNIVIVGDEIARMQIERKARDFTVPFEYAASVEEAERMLDGLERLN